MSALRHRNLFPAPANLDSVRTLVRQGKAHLALKRVQEWPDSHPEWWGQTPHPLIEFGLVSLHRRGTVLREGLLAMLGDIPALWVARALGQGQDPEACWLLQRLPETRLDERVDFRGHSATYTTLALHHGCWRAAELLAERGQREPSAITHLLLARLEAREPERMVQAAMNLGGHAGRLDALLVKGRARRLSSYDTALSTALYRRRWATARSLLAHVPVQEATRAAGQLMAALCQDPSLRAQSQNASRAARTLDAAIDVLDAWPAGASFDADVVLKSPGIHPRLRVALEAALLRAVLPEPACLPVTTPRFRL